MKYSASKYPTHLEVDELPLPLDRLPPDADVEADHDGDGHEEGDHDRHDRHHSVPGNELKNNDLLMILQTCLVKGNIISRNQIHFRMGPACISHSLSGTVRFPSM